MSADTAVRRGGTALPVGVLLVTVSCFQLGGVLAKGLFPAVGPLGASALRMGLAALMLAVVAPPWRARVTAGLRGPLLLYGLSLAGLNLFFYLALQRIPVGIAVTIDFTGPLAVAVAQSRQAIDLLWVGLAALGILLLVPIGPLAAPLDPRGVALSFGSAACWAVYILCGKRIVGAMPVRDATALGVAVAALAILPFGWAQAGSTLLSPAVLPTALVIAGLSSALPYTLELFALNQLPTRVFGILMSLEPAFGALYGWLLLGEVLTARQVVAIVSVVLASAGAALAPSAARGSDRRA